MILALKDNYNILSRMCCRVIGICGRRRSGKDTVAAILNTLYSYENVKISTDLKDALRILFGFNHEQVEGHLKDVVDERWGVSPRQAMQFIGTEVMQYKINELLPYVGRKFWIKGFMNQHILNKDVSMKKIVITDIRFLHEYEELKMHLNNDFMMLRIERNLPTTTVDEHSSEQEYLRIPFDHTIRNNGTLEELRNNVINIFGKP